MKNNLEIMIKNDEDKIKIIKMIKELNFIFRD